MSVQLRNKPVAEAGGNSRERFTAFLVDDASEKLVRQSVTEMALPFSSVHRGDVSKAIAYLSTSRSPMALMVDVSGSDMAASEVYRLAEVCEPGTAVVVIGDRNDVGLYRDFVRAGVSDYIVKPLTRGLVQAALDGLLGISPTNTVPLTAKTGTVVSVIGARGGVGASTVAVNVASHLANKENRRVALVDLDVQFGDCALMLDIKITGGLREALETPHRIDDLFIERSLVRSGERLFVMACEDRLDSPIKIDHQALAPLLAALRKQFHYVILDVPRNSGILLQQAIDQSSARIIVTDQTTHAIRDTIRLKPLFETQQHSTRNIIVLNRVGEAGKSGVGIKEMSEALGLNIHATIPFNAKGVIAAANAGMPIVNTRGPVSNAIETVARELGGRAGSKTARKFWGLGFGKGVGKGISK